MINLIVLHFLLTIFFTIKLLTVMSPQLTASKVLKNWRILYGTIRICNCDKTIAQKKTATVKNSEIAAELSE